MSMVKYGCILFAVSTFFFMLVTFPGRAQSQSQPQSQSQSQSPSQSQPLMSPAGDDVSRKLSTYSAMATAGMVLTISGAVLAVSGSVLAVAGAIGLGFSFITLQWSDLSGWAALYVSGLIILGVGAAAFLTGLPLWIVGAVKKKKYKKMLTGFMPIIGYDPWAGAALVGFKTSF